MAPTRREVEAGSWDEYRLLILGSLGRIEKALKDLEEKVDHNAATRTKEIEAVRLDVAMLKLKAAFIGFLSGTIAAALFAAIARKWIG